MSSTTTLQKTKSYDLVTFEAQTYGDWRDEFHKNGCVVIPNVISPEKAQYYCDKQIEWLKEDGDEQDEEFNLYYTSFVPKFLDASRNFYRDEGQSLLQKADKMSMAASIELRTPFIDVPLQPYEDTEPDAFEGFTKTTYRAEGPHLPFRGKWTAQIRVTDGTDAAERGRKTFLYFLDQL